LPEITDRSTQQSRRDNKVMLADDARAERRGRTASTDADDTTDTVAPVA
jgi:hypothetical protein